MKQLVEKKDAKVQTLTGLSPVKVSDPGMSPVGKNGTLVGLVPVKLEEKSTFSVNRPSTDPDSGRYSYTDCSSDVVRVRKVRRIR